MIVAALLIAVAVALAGCEHTSFVDDAKRACAPYGVESMDLDHHRFLCKVPR